MLPRQDFPNFNPQPESMRPRLLILLLLLSPGLFAQQTSHNDRYTHVSGLIKTYYLENVNIDSIAGLLDRKTLNDTSGIRKLLSRLDPYSAFYDSIDYAALKTDLAGTFGGLGLSFTISDDTVIVSKLFPGSPAEKAGMKPGDQVMLVDDKPMSGVQAGYDAVMGALRGLKGTAVKIGIKRNREAKLIHLQAVRDKIVVPSVPAAFMLDGQTGYIKISQFSDSTGAETHAALLQLKNAGMKKLLLDLRDNIGGYMKQATLVADEFLPAGSLVVYTKGRTGRSDVNALAGGLFEKGEMVVLINERTASSGEILTGALQDNKRALIMGNRSFGKGLVQKIFPIGDSSEAVKLTIAKYYTPSGVCIQQPYEENEYLYKRNNETITAKKDSASENLQQSHRLWGITPDIFIAEDTAAPNSFFRQLEERGYLSQPAIGWYAGNVSTVASYGTPEKFISAFEVDESLLTRFKEQLPNREKEDADYFPKMNYDDAIFEKATPKMITAIKAYIAQAHWGDGAFYQVWIPLDEGLQSALRQLSAKK